jgi:hypothetical protein
VGRVGRVRRVSQKGRRFTPPALFVCPIRGPATGIRFQDHRPPDQRGGHAVRQNLFNANTGSTFNQNFGGDGATYRQEQTVLNPRFVRFNVTVDF